MANSDNSGGSESLTVVYSLTCVRHSAAVPDVNRDQIDNVLLLAVLAACAKYNIGTQSDDWYRTFDDTIQNVEWIVDAGTWKRVTSTGTFDIQKLLPDNTVGAEEGLLAVRAEHYPVRGALRFGTVPGREVAVLFATSATTGRPGVLRVELASLAFSFKSDLPVEDPLAQRPWADIADAYLRTSKYSIDTTAPGYDAIQERIRKTLGTRTAKYLYRTSIK